MCSKRNLLDKVVSDNLPNIVIDEPFYVVGHRLWFDKKMVKNEQTK